MESDNRVPPNQALNAGKESGSPHGTAARRLGLRPAGPDDEPFLYRVYAGTREDELAAVDWDAAQQAAFLRGQFEAQHHYYHEQFGSAEFQIILLGGEPIGRLYVDRRDDEIRIIDIALLPAHRNAGLGEALLTDLLV